MQKTFGLKEPKMPSSKRRHSISAIGKARSVASSGCPARHIISGVGKRAASF